MIETWILIACTQAWGLCGTIIRRDYADEESCYKAMDTLYKYQGKENFKYITCSIKENSHE